MPFPYTLEKPEKPLVGPEEIPTPERQVEKQKVWLNRWISDPEFVRRTEQSLKRNKEYLEGIRYVKPTNTENILPIEDLTGESAQKRALKHLDRASIFIDPAMGESEYGEYNPYKERIKLNPKGLESGVGVHEGTHSTEIDRLIPAINRYLPPSFLFEEAEKAGYEGLSIGEEYPSTIEYAGDRGSESIRGKEFSFDLGEEIHTYEGSSLEYLLDPQEMYANIMQLRYKADIKPGQTFTDEDIKELKDKYIKTFDFLKFFDDNVVKEMLNTWSGVDTPQSRRRLKDLG